MGLESFYADRLEQLHHQIKAVKRKSLLFSILRMTAFIATVGAAYLSYPQTNWMTAIILVGIAVFLFLVSKSTDIKNRLAFLLKLHEINAIEELNLKGDFSKNEDGAEFISSHHFYNQDIDLFGSGSLFQRINRAGTKKGKYCLADQLNSNSIEGISLRQEAILELRDKIDWRQNFQATGLIIENEVAVEDLIKWMKSFNLSLPSFAKYLPILFSLCSLSMITLYAFGIVSGVSLGFWFGLGLAITSKNLKSTNQLSANGSKVQATIKQYAKLILAIEQSEFKAELNKVRQAELLRKGESVSEILGQLAKAFERLDQRNNLIFGFLGNGFLLWDMRQTFTIESWVQKNELESENWFAQVALFDAFNSFANYSFNHPDYTRPILEGEKGIQATELGHPLLKTVKRIDNSLEMENEDFLIVTGANMAGKSTFLRTVALSVVMANCGLPVCAKEFKYGPVKLISSMRTTDSLQDDSSYFFAELSRLKFIVDALATDDYFIILDEILKGTNSKDKAEGSQKFVERLVGTKSMGIIATHDLSLCELENRLGAVKNYYFDAQIKNEELYFDYTFKKGVCQNMNASFLLSKMGIVE